MSDLERFNEIVDDIWELVFGTVRRPEVKFKYAMTKKPKRARTKKGTYRADDPKTKDINEAWVDGKTPKKRKKNGKK
tara:strand:+ start:791 stop:1021 length:231 start_codon:yes stop_codon:yes gene_type:complete